MKLFCLYMLQKKKEKENGDDPLGLATIEESWEGMNMVSKLMDALPVQTISAIAPIGKEKTFRWQRSDLEQFQRRKAIERFLLETYNTSHWGQDNRNYWQALIAAGIT